MEKGKEAISRRGERHMGQEGLALAVDVGTTTIKAGVVDGAGQVLRTAQKELEVLRDEQGRAEHDPHALFQAFVQVCREAAQGYAESIGLLVLSGYQLSLLPLSRDGEPLAPIMTLLDTRPQESFPELLQRVDAQELYRRTGCPPLFIYPFSKLYWLKTHRPSIFQEAWAFTGVKDYLLHRLLGRLCTEASLATATQLMNLSTLQWDPYPLEVLGLSAERLPEVVPSDAVLGTLPPASRSLLGLSREVAVVPGVYDGGAVGLGLGAMEGRVGVINLGTTAMLRVAAPQPALDSQPLMRLQTCYLTSGHWFPGGAINNAGVVLRWLRDNVLGLDYEAQSAEAASVPDPANLFFLPFLSGERNPQIGNVASGVFLGLRGHHRRGHLVRAAMEGVAFALRLVLEALRENGVAFQELRVGGGGARSAVWMQILASALGLPLQTTPVAEPSLVGSAMLGWVALGHYPNLQEATKAMVRKGPRFQPEEEKRGAYEERFAFFRYLVEHLGEAFRRHQVLGLGG